MLFLGALSAEAQHYDRGYETVPSAPFIPKGTWSVGGTAKYTQHINDGYNMLVISDINSTGYNIAVKPKVMYTFKDNMSVGFRLLSDPAQIQRFRSFQVIYSFRKLQEGSDVR